jgi:hypothetical protein
MAPAGCFFARPRAAGRSWYLAQFPKNSLQPEWWQRVLSFCAAPCCRMRTPAESHFASQVSCNLRCSSQAPPAQPRRRLVPPRRRQPPRRRSSVPGTSGSAAPLSSASVPATSHSATARSSSTPAVGGIITRGSYAGHSSLAASRTGSSPD